jgi:hypothetical protein
VDQVVGDLAALQGRGQGRGFTDITTDPESIRPEPPGFPGLSRQASDLMASLHQGAMKVPTDESGGTGEENPRGHA